MVYLLGFLMGYFSGANYLAEQEIREEGCHYSNPIVGFFSSIGRLSSVLLITAAFYFIIVSTGSGILEGIYFVLASSVGMFMSGYWDRFGLNFMFGALTIFVNLGLLFQVYSLTH